MSEQHPHNKIGNVIGEHKKRLFDRLKTGADIDAAVGDFIVDLSNALKEIVKNLNPRSVPD